MRQPAPSVLSLLVLLAPAIFLGLLLPMLSQLFFGSRLGVRFVLPNGYVGEFEVVLDSKDGEELVLEGRDFVFRIPETGVLRVTSDGPLNTFARQTVAYEDGTELKLEVLRIVNLDGARHRYRIHPRSPMLRGAERK